MVLSGFFPKNDSLEDNRLSYSGYFKEKVVSAIFKHISVNFGITVIISLLSQFIATNLHYLRIYLSQ